MLPAAFLSRMEALLGEEYPDFLASYDRPLQKGLRIGRKAAGLTRLPFELTPIPWSKSGFFYQSESRPGKHPWHEAGLYYLQEPSAMAPAALLSPQPGERILDLCAAPGGKATALADALQGQGLLVANEINGKRAGILSRNIERMGIANALVLNMHPQAMEVPFSCFFDRILVDAPCSGEGMFRKEVAAVTDWSPDTVAMCAQRQLEILRSAAAMLRPGGYLCYSTCTFSPEENEGVISSFLELYPEFSPVSSAFPWLSPAHPDWVQPADDRLLLGFRLWPHKLAGEGHFAILLQKDGNNPGTAPPSPKSIVFPQPLADFLSTMDIHLPDGHLISRGDTLYLLPPDAPALNGLKVLRPGLELGVLKKGRFEPSHALALWLDTCTVTADFPVDSHEILDYLHGQVLSGSQQGWTLITADGFSIGWAKGSGGQLKNHFPKGLRWL